MRRLRVGVGARMRLPAEAGIYNKVRRAAPAALRTSRPITDCIGVAPTCSDLRMSSWRVGGDPHPLPDFSVAHTGRGPGQGPAPVP